VNVTMTDRRLLYAHCKQWAVSYCGGTQPSPMNSRPGNGSHGGWSSSNSYRQLGSRSGSRTSRVLMESHSNASPWYDPDFEELEG
jgi:hypothetical protein